MGTHKKTGKQKGINLRSMIRINVKERIKQGSIRERSCNFRKGGEGRPQRRLHEEEEGGSHVCKGVPGSRDNMCKGHEVVMDLVYLFMEEQKGQCDCRVVREQR